MVECNICFCDIDSIFFTCSNNTCNSRICLECIEKYIMLTDSGLPKCVSSNCNGEFLFSEIQKTNNKEVIQKYENLCFNFLKNDNIDEISQEKNQKALIEKIRKEKHDFIMREFPTSISFIINTALKSKLNKINKTNKEHIKDSLKKLNKKCPNVFCYSGVLDVDFTCLACTHKFCKKCEAQIKDKGEHICKKEDLDTINFVENLVKCPTCKLPVTRSYGCNNITCSNCKTNFDYVTGKRTIAGNHSDDTIKLKTYSKPSLILEKENYDDLYILNLLRKIEAKEPEPYSFSKIITVIKKYMDLESKMEYDNLQKIKNELALKYEKYRLVQFEKQKFFKCMMTVQEHYKNKSLSEEVLVKINDILV